MNFPIDGSLKNHARYVDAYGDAKHRARRDKCYYRMQRASDGSYDVHKCPKGDDGLYHGGFRGRLVSPHDDD